jgi:N-acetylmuramoyl-L-alanine amidase CwlA
MATELQERRRYLRRRHHRRRVTLVLAAAVVIAGVITAAIFLGALLSAPRPAEVQKKIDRLDWVDKSLLPVNDYSRPGAALKKVNAIVVHYVGNPNTTAAQNRSYYAGLADSCEAYISSNFLIGLEGEIVECVPVDEVAYCSNWRNEDTISIECCHPDETGSFTDDTYRSLVRLTAWLCAEFGLDAGEVIRHYDVSGKECPKCFVDNAGAWEEFKAEVQSAADKWRKDPSDE